MRIETSPMSTRLISRTGDILADRVSREDRVECEVPLEVDM
jgi:hypothetical protein